MKIQKIKSVIMSCRTPEQLNSAVKWYCEMSLSPDNKLMLLEHSAQQREYIKRLEAVE